MSPRGDGVTVSQLSAVTRARALPIPKIADHAQSDWDQGLCGEYAAALQQLYPQLNLGVIGTLQSYGWDGMHYFAHDHDYAYDVTGAHPLDEFLEPVIRMKLDYRLGYAIPESIPTGSPVVACPDKVIEAKRLVSSAIE